MLAQWELRPVARPVCTDRHHETQRVVALGPELRDLIVLLPIQIDDALALLFRQIGTGRLGLERMLELLRAGSVAQSQDAGLADKPFNRRFFTNVLAIDLARED